MVRKAYCNTVTYNLEKYKAYILKYKALILKYVPCVFCNMPCVFLWEILSLKKETNIIEFFLFLE